MAVAAIQTREFIPISRVDFIGHLRLFWVFLIPQKLTCGVLGALYVNYTQAFLSSQGRVKLNRFHVLWN